MKKIKVAEVITRMDWGGSPDIVRMLCKGLNPESYDVTLIIGDTKNPSAKTSDFMCHYAGKIVRVPFLKRNINPVYDFTALIKLYFLFKKMNFDIVHTHTAKAGALGRIAAFLARIPAIAHTPHGHNFYGYFNPLMSRCIIYVERFFSKFTDKTIALTNLEKNDLVKFGVIDSEHIDVIYQGLELDKYLNFVKNAGMAEKLFDIGKDNLVIGAVARVETVKGLIYFVSAAEKICKTYKNVKFVIVGEGSQRIELEKVVSACGLKDKFIFAGWREDILDVVSCFDVLVLPSLNEAVGMILIEAQAAGIPVVATNVGGIPEIVKDNETGILVNARDSDGLANALIKLLNDRALRSKLGFNGKKWVQGRFGNDIMVQKISDLYRKLLKEKGVISE